MGSWQYAQGTLREQWASNRYTHFVGDPYTNAHGYSSACPATSDTAGVHTPAAAGTADFEDEAKCYRQDNTESSSGADDATLPVHDFGFEHHV